MTFFNWGHERQTPVPKLTDLQRVEMEVVALQHSIHNLHQDIQTMKYILAKMEAKK